MRTLTSDAGEIRFASRVDKAIEALYENKKKGEDICAVDFLLTKINDASEETVDFNKMLWTRNAESNSKVLDLLMDVVLWMCSKRLRYDDTGNHLDPFPIEHGDNTKVRFVDLRGQLENLILFVDESLPRGAGDGPDPAALNRLRFVRNLGRALTMKVVVAGTAAAAANIIAEPVATESNVASRNGPGETAWIECQFLWKPMLKDDVEKAISSKLAFSSKPGLEEALISELARGRPYLVHLLRQVIDQAKYKGEPKGTTAQGEKDVAQRRKRRPSFSPSAKQTRRLFRLYSIAPHASRDHDH